MENERDQKFIEKKEMRRTNYMRYIEEKLVAAKEGKKVSMATNKLGPTEL